jgi:hypothetical protein
MIARSQTVQAFLIAKDAATATMQLTPQFARTANQAGWALVATSRASMGSKTQWILASASATRVGPAKAAILNALATVILTATTSACATRFRGGAAICAKFQVALGTVRTVPGMAIATLRWQHAHAMKVGLASVATSQTVQVIRTVTIVANATILSRHQFASTVQRQMETLLVGWALAASNRAFMVSKILWIQANASAYQATTAMAASLNALATGSTTAITRCVSVLTKRVSGVTFAKFQVAQATGIFLTSIA